MVVMAFTAKTLAQACTDAERESLSCAYNLACVNSVCATEPTVCPNGVSDCADLTKYCDETDPANPVCGDCPPDTTESCAA